MVEKFKQLGISESGLKAIKELGFEEPSEIQEKTIPLVLEGKDVIAGASTGSGKTLAFGLGVIHNARPDYGVQGLILTPTRELAQQITGELRKFLGDKKLKVISVYGGTSMLKQIEELKIAEIVVATPGRILDHLSRRTLDLQYLNTLVLDEADRMLDMGFKEDVEKIISQCPEKRQTLLYSATISPEIAIMTERYMNNPVEVSAEPHVDPSKLAQGYYDIEDNLKFSLLKHLLEHENSKLVMVFCNTRHNVDFVANNLKAMGIEALPIHGGFSQDKRNRILQQFHSKDVHVMVCTDVAARGLDIKGVSHVYNYDIPRDPKEYVHRIGRTARAGNEGKVINVVTNRDYDNFSNVLRYHPDFKIKPEKTPYVEKVHLKWMPDRNDGRGRPSGRFGGRNDRGPSRGNYRRGDSGGPRRDSRPSSGPRRDSGRSYGRSEGGRPSSGSGPRRDSRPSSGGRSYGGRSEGRSEDRKSYGRGDGRNDDRRSESSRGYEKREMKRRDSGRSSGGGRPSTGGRGPRRDGGSPSRGTNTRGPRRDSNSKSESRPSRNSRSRR